MVRLSGEGGIGDDSPAADTGEVSGWLGLLLNGLNSQDGVNLVDSNVLEDVAPLRFSDLAEDEERVDRMEAWDGEVLRLRSEAVASDCVGGCFSIDGSRRGGRSGSTIFGLSAIGGILDPGFDVR